MQPLNEKGKGKKEEEEKSRGEAPKNVSEAFDFDLKSLGALALHARQLFTFFFFLVRGYSACWILQQCNVWVLKQGSVNGTNTTGPPQTGAMSMYKIVQWHTWNLCEEFPVLS